MNDIAEHSLALMDEYNLMMKSRYSFFYGQLRTTDNSIQTETRCSNWTFVAEMLTRTGCSRPMSGPMTELSSVVKALPRTSSYTNTTIAIYTDYI